MRYSDVSAVYDRLRIEIDSMPFLFEQTVRDMVFNQIRAQAKIHCSLCSIYLMQLDAQKQGQDFVFMTSPEALLNLAIQAAKRNYRGGNIKMAFENICALRDMLVDQSFAIQSGLEKFDSMPIKRKAA